MQRQHTRPVGSGVAYQWFYFMVMRLLAHAIYCVAVLKVSFFMQQEIASYCIKALRAQMRSCCAAPYMTRNKSCAVRKFEARECEKRTFVLKSREKGRVRL